MSGTFVELLGQYGYGVLFVTVFLMNAGLPLPGHLLYLTASVLCGRGALWLPLVMGGSAAAALLGAAAGFTLGQRGGRRLIDEKGPKVGLTPARVAAMERFFDRHGVKAVFLTRFFVIIRTFGAIFAGVSRVPTRRFLLVSAAGAVAWAGLVGSAGYVFGERWHVVEDYLGIGGLVLLGLLVVAGLAHVLWTRRRRRG